MMKVCGVKKPLICHGCNYTIGPDDSAGTHPDVLAKYCRGYTSWGVPIGGVNCTIARFLED